MTDPTDDINRIIIGLGGQGSRIVNEVRNAVLKHGAIPVGLEFIAIDSDRVALSKLDSVPEDQCIHLAAPDDHITETVVPWLPHEFRPKAGGGCGMQRLTGKAMYLVHRHRIMETVREVARRLRQRTQVSNFMVVIVNAFGGGTGSGMVIDFSIDLRRDLKEITGQDPLMFGVGVLPSRSETIQRANGVALLKELHFLLSHKEPVVVGGRDHSNPFELYFLTSREVMGIERDDDLMQSIVRFTIDLGLIPSSSTDNASSGKGAGWVDLQDIRTLVKGAGHMFSTFGYYRAAFPAEALLDHFQALDRLDALQKEMPGLATDLDARRQALEDKKIAAAHADEILQRGRARAAKLRSTGVLGSNRPDLAKLLGDLGRTEDEIRKTRREIQAAETELPRLAQRRDAIEGELRDTQARIETLLANLTAPAQSRTNYTVPLTKEECAFLAANRHLITEGHFRAAMVALGRLPDYHDKTMEVVGKNKILYLPLVNYRMSFHTAAAFPAPVLAALKKHGFVRFDHAGNPVIADDHLWMVMAMLASNQENIDANKVAARAFKEVVEGHVARRAEAKIVRSLSKPWEVVIHSWMVGIQVAPVAPGHPPRLKELEWLMPEYEQVVREGGLAQHHAFLYGDPVAFAELASVPVDRISMAKTHDLVTSFWASYAPIDTPARWLQLPPVLAETMVVAQELARHATALEDAVDGFRASGADLRALDQLTGALSKEIEAIHAFSRAYAEDAEPLKERLGNLTKHLERARQGPRDAEKIVAMEELAAEALGVVSDAVAVLTELRSNLLASIRAVMAAPTPPPDAADPASRSATVRLQHAFGKAEHIAAEVHLAVTDALAHLGDLERTLQRAQATIRSRALAPLSRPLPRATPARQDAPVIEMEATLERQALASGNGHHAIPAQMEEHE